MPITKYKPEYCDTLIKWMGQGKSNLELAAKFGITEATFYDWRKDWPEFQEAYDIGNPKRFTFLMEKADQIFLEDKNDKGYKHWLKKIQHMYKDYAPEKAENSTTNNIQISNMNVLNGKSDTELLEVLNQKLLKCRLEPIEVKVIEDKHDN